MEKKPVFTEWSISDNPYDDYKTQYSSKKSDNDHKEQNCPHRDEICRLLGTIQINNLPIIVRRVSIDGGVRTNIESLVSVIPGFTNNRYIAVFRETTGDLIFIDCIRIDFIQFHNHYYNGGE